jgi:AraC-like DNA-binding protein
MAPLTARRVHGVRKERWITAPNASHGKQLGRATNINRTAKVAAWARGRLRDARPSAETAIAVGFADQARFTGTFKAAFGMTPGRCVKLCGRSR